MKKPSIIIIHFATTAIAQCIILGCFLSSYAFSVAEIVINFIVWIMLLLFDFFVCKAIILKYNLTYKHTFFIHGIDLILILPLLFIRIYTLLPMVDIDGSMMSRSFKLGEIIFSVEFFTFYFLLISERILLVRHSQINRA